jgi:hypothetical protein
MIVNYRLRCAPEAFRPVLNQMVMSAAQVLRPVEASPQPFSGWFIACRKRDK